MRVDAERVGQRDVLKVRLAEAEGGALFRYHASAPQPLMVSITRGSENVSVQRSSSVVCRFSVTASN